MAKPIVDPVYGNFWQGGVEYVPIEPGSDKFHPSGVRVQVDSNKVPILVDGKQVELERIAPGYNDDPAQIAADKEAREAFLEDIDYEGDPRMQQATGAERFDGSFQPGVFEQNPDFYVKPIKPSDADTAPDVNGESKYITSIDGQKNTVWTLNPRYDLSKASSSKKLGTTAGTSTANTTSVYTTINNTLKNYGFSAADITELSSFMQLALTNNDSVDTVTQNLRETPVYKRRFPGMALRQGNNYNAITEADYLILEDGYVSAMRLAGLPEGFYDDRQDFATFIGNDVSAAEVQRRVNLAQSVSQDANPEVLTQLQELYNIDTKKLVAFYLDPTADGAQNLLKEERKVASASLSASVLSAVGEGLNVAAAERIQKAGMTLRDTRGLSSAVGVLGASINEESFSASDLAEGTFGTNVNAADSLRRRVTGRTANFRGKSGLLADSSGFSGLGEAV